MVFLFTRPRPNQEGESYVFPYHAVMKPISIDSIYNPCLDPLLYGHFTFAGRRWWICMGVAQLPAYENVGSALRDEISHMQDFWLYSSVETLSLLEGMNKD